MKATIKYMLILYIIFISIINSHAYDLSSNARNKIIDACISVMPPLFGSALESNKDSIMEGFTEGLIMLSENYPVLEYQIYKNLIDNMDSIKSELVSSIKTRPDFKKISKSYGLLAAYSFHISSPIAFLTDNPERKAVISSEYHKLINRQSNNILLYFYGFYNKCGIINPDKINDLSTSLLSAFLKDPSTVYPHTVFDTRSIPFGIAQIHINSAFSWTVRYWFNIWRDSGGYIKDSPYHNLTPAIEGQYISIVR